MTGKVSAPRSSPSPPWSFCCSPSSPCLFRLRGEVTLNARRSGLQFGGKKPSPIKTRRPQTLIAGGWTTCT